MKDPMIYELGSLVSLADSGVTSSSDGVHWVPARPLGSPSWRKRLKAAWLVFTGRADAVRWPQGQ